MGENKMNENNSESINTEPFKTEDNSKEENRTEEKSTEDISTGGNRVESCTGANRDTDHLTDVNRFWHEFLRSTGRPEDTGYLEAFYFELSEYWANELLRLVLIGQKKATASSFLSYQAEGSRVPQVGDLSIVTDYYGTPKCVIETTQITILPFKEMTYDICKREGEDDNLESWQKGHLKFFTQEGLKLGYEFTEEMPVVFEDFEVVYRVD